MSLKKLFPKSPSFKVKALNRSFDLGPLTVEDEIWMAQNFEDKLLEDLSTLDLLTGSRLAFRLMRSKDKEKYFKKEKREFIDENGDSLTEEIGGVVLLRALMSGQEEQIKMFEAVFQTIINSRPELSEKKKKIKVKEK